MTVDHFFRPLYAKQAKQLAVWEDCLILFSISVFLLDLMSVSKFFSDKLAIASSLRIDFLAEDAVSIGSSSPQSESLDSSSSSSSFSFSFFCGTWSLFCVKLSELFVLWSENSWKLLASVFDLLLFYKSKVSVPLLDKGGFSAFSTALAKTFWEIFLQIIWAYIVSSPPLPNAALYISTYCGFILLINSSVSGIYLTKFSSSALNKASSCYCFLSCSFLFVFVYFMNPFLAWLLMLDSIAFHLFFFCKNSCSFFSMISWIWFS